MAVAVNKTAVVNTFKNTEWILITKEKTALFPDMSVSFNFLMILKGLQNTADLPQL